MKKTDYQKTGIHDPSLCRVCIDGTCCREGVEADLFEVARILRMPLDIPKPWFDYLGRDRRFPSGFKFSTRLASRRCIFQKDDMRCLVYAQRPRFCREFPLEGGRRAPEYKSLCHHAAAKRRAGRR